MWQATILFSYVLILYYVGVSLAAHAAAAASAAAAAAAVVYQLQDWVT